MAARRTVHPERLKALRDAAGLSRAQVAAALEVSERTVYRHEAGVTPLRRLYLPTLAELYGVEVDDFYASMAEDAA